MRKMLLGTTLIAALVAGLAGAQTRIQVTKNSTNDYYPVLSDDGQWLAFIGEVNFQYEIFTTPTQTLAPKQITTGGPASIPDGLAITGDGNTLYFISQNNIWTMPVTGGTPTSVTALSGTVRANMGVTTSYDGRYVGFTTYDSATRFWDFHVVDTQTKVVTNITKNTAVNAISSGAVSGDNTKIVYNRQDTGGQEQIFIAAPDGTGAKPLTSFPNGFTRYPTIDKKATRVAFESNNTGRYQIYTVRADGTGLVDISKNTVGDDRSARISADGDRVTWKSRWQLTNVGNDMFMNYPEGGTSRQWTFFGGMTTSNPNDSHGANGDGTILSFATRYNVGGGNPQADHEIFLWRDVFTRTGAATPGASIALNIDDSQNAGAQYLIRCAFSRNPGIQLPGVGTVPLAPDALFFLSGLVPTVFQNFSGALNASGQAAGGVAIPQSASLIGLDFYAAAVSVTSGVNIYNPLKVTIE